jgi:hypothetical protein
VAEFVLRTDDGRALAIEIDLDEFPDFSPYLERDVSGLEAAVREFLEENYS